MTWLKKFGLAVLKIGQVFLGIEPLAAGIVGAAAPGNTSIVNDLTRIGQAVTTVEAVFAAVSDPAAKTGADKLKAASALTMQILETSQMIAGKKIKNEAAFAAAAQTITGGVADLLNALE